MIGWQIGRPSSFELAVSELGQEERVREREQAQQLTATARDLRDALSPVVEGLAQTLPSTAEPSTTEAASLRDIRRWRAITAESAERLADPQSAGNGVNMAREGMTASLQQLANALDTYAVATVTQEARRDLLDIAAAQRDSAVSTWGVAATQIDLLNIEHGFGHAHIYLARSQETGDEHADSLPSGPR